MCLLCRKFYADKKIYNIQKHFDTNHKDVNNQFPLSSGKRFREILRLKENLASEKRVVKVFLDSNELITLATYKIAFTLAKYGKAYGDGEMVKELLSSTIEILCENIEEETKTKILKQINCLALSHQTIARRIEDIANEMENSLKENLRTCLAFSLQTDESNDVRDISQLIFWVRFITTEYDIREEMLGFVPLELHTCGVDILNAFHSIQNKFNLDVHKFASISTDGAPAMIGSKVGFVTRLKRELKEKEVNSPLISYHCIIHQENLCAKVLGANSNLLDTVTKVNI